MVDILSLTKGCLADYGRMGFLALFFSLRFYFCLSYSPAISSCVSSLCSSYLFDKTSGDTSLDGELASIFFLGMQLLYDF
jgi:hypothetical protein